VSAAAAETFERIGIAHRAADAREYRDHG
jgi:hypothetical protein